MLDRILFAFCLWLALVAPNASVAAPEMEVDALQSFLAQHAGTEWSGPAELWLDPEGNQAESSDARLRLSEHRIDYSWSWRGDEQTGYFLIEDDGLSWRDSWHQDEVVALFPTGDTLALFAVEYAYPAGEGPDWHWRMHLSRRPAGQLVLQMTNVPPWGEEARAVRMVFEREH